MFAIPAGMGTGAHETALVCDSNGQAKACVQKGHTTSWLMGGFPYQRIMAEAVKFQSDKLWLFKTSIDQL